MAQADKSPAGSYGRYVAAVLCGTALLLFAIARFNAVTNPVNRALDSDAQTFCDPAAASGEAAWLLKSLILEREDYDAIIFGSSKIESVDPSLYGYFRFIDAGVAGGLPEFMYELMDAYSTPKVKVVVLALDFYMFNEALYPYTSADDLKRVADYQAKIGKTPEWNRDRADPPESLGDRFRDAGKDLPYLLSLRVLGERLLQQAVALNKTKLLARGNVDVTASTAEMDARERAGTRHIERDRYDNNLQVLLTQHYSPYTFSGKRVEVLEKMRDLMALRGIPLLVMIDPENIEARALIDRLPAKADFERYRQSIKRIFPNAADFSGPDYADPKYYYDWDPIHFLPSTAAVLVNQLLERNLPSGLLKGSKRSQPDKVPAEQSVNCN